jgi:hypothetical protein
MGDWQTASPMTGKLDGANSTEPRVQGEWLAEQESFEIAGVAWQTTPVFDTYWRFAQARQELYHRRVRCSNPPIANNSPLRIDISANTCNGCHGQETRTDFQQINFRNPGSPSDLSAFLVGCSDKTSQASPCLPPNLGGTNQCTLQTALVNNSNLVCQMEVVLDPAIGSAQQPATSFGDLFRRAQYMNGLLEGSCTGTSLLQSLVKPHINFVH